MIDWNKLKKSDVPAIRRITERGVQVLKEMGKKADAVAISMDVGATHIHLPLDLKKFLKADDSNFYHDFFGIRKHLDRNTGKLKDFFVPRCAQKVRDPRVVAAMKILKKRNPLAFKKEI